MSLHKIIIHPLDFNHRKPTFYILQLNVMMCSQTLHVLKCSWVVYTINHGLIPRPYKISDWMSNSSHFPTLSFSSNMVTLKSHAEWLYTMYQFLSHTMSWRQTWRQEVQTFAFQTNWLVGSNHPTSWVRPWWFLSFKMIENWRASSHGVQVPTWRHDSNFWVSRIHWKQG